MTQNLEGLKLGQGWNRGIKGFLKNKLCPNCKRIKSPTKSHVCKSRIPWNKGLTKTKDIRVMGVSKALTGIKRRPESIEKSRINAGKRIREQYKNGERKWWGLNPKNKDIWERILKNGFSSLNPETQQKAFRGLRKKPNRIETYLDKILQKHFPNQWEFTGDGKMMINHKFPDFVNINGQKKAILVNGIYWHTKFKKRKKLSRETIEVLESYPYEEAGYKVLHVWEDELAEITKGGKYIWHEDINCLLTKIKKFDTLLTS